MKKFTLIFFLLGSFSTFAQTGLKLTIADLMSWQISTANANNVCSIPVHHRVRSGNYQIASGLDTNCKILYCPDGMDNFGPYVDSANQFNLFNFSHWQYIDILTWFGGSASFPIILPSKAWVDAAHRNGVKVIGTVFMAPTVYGGSQAQMQSFLQTDSAGNFIAAQKLKAIADYYNFDGWIMNFETGVNSSTGALASSFMAKFDSLYSGELIWYDAMLQNGSVSYQNKLNANNAYFFQHSTGLFTNYNWASAATVQSSATYASNLGLSPYNVYTGADMWPTRNAQPAFTNYNWINNIITSNVAKTSIAVFAMNFTFNYAGFSNFNNDPADYANFYIAERKIFSGLDEDPFTADGTWKGFGNYIPVKTTITSFPFETNFNTGHGMNTYANGSILTPGPWHNMSRQDILPSWTFYKNNISIDYDFNDAFSGGNSLGITSATGGSFSIPLYSTDLITANNLINAELNLKSSSTSIDSVGIELIKSNGNMIAFFYPSLNGSWENLTANASSFSSNDTITGIKLNIYSSAGFTMNIGRIFVTDNSANIIVSRPGYNGFEIYSNVQGNIQIKNQEASDGKLIIYDTKGSKIYSDTVSGNSNKEIFLGLTGTFIYEFTDVNNKKSTGKFIVR